MSFDDATLLDIAGVAFHALERTELQPGGTLAVIGTGPLGVFAARLAMLRGANTVYCVDVADRPRPLAESSGAVFFDATASPDWPERVVDATGGWGVDAVVETVGEPETLEQGRNILAPGGTMAMLAVHAETMSFRVTDLGQERTLRSAANYTFADFQARVDLASSGRLKLDDLITHRVRLSDVANGFALARDRASSGAMKVVVEPEND